MDRSTLRRGVLPGLLAAALLAGPAAAPPVSGQQAPGDPVADRQRLMKQNGASAREIGDHAKAGNIDAIVASADTIAQNARQIPALFPRGSGTDASYAKPEIWERWSEFEAAARNMEAKALQLKDAAAKRDTAAVQAIVPSFGREACGTCHTPFRRPKG
jgi:cytochrome c556